ncbi:hypothetical protein WAC87_003525 [Shigella flexneri]
MNRVMVITYPKKNVNFSEVMDAEYAMTNALRNQGVIEHLFAKENDGGGVVVFNAESIDEVKERVAALPLFPYFEKVEYFPLNKIY